MNFNEIGLSESIVLALGKQNITIPTDVQAQSIPEILKGENVIMKSQTGSGKTLAYLLPIFAKPVEKGNQVVIIVPTRELAMQVHTVVGDFAKVSGINLNSAVLFGGVNIKMQIEKLKEKPQIIIGTIDRVLELIKKKKVSAHTIKTFIVDEADKLVDKQSVDGLKAVRKCFMRDTQCVFVSATFAPKNIEQIGEIAPNCKLIQTATKEVVPQNITHLYMVCETRDKLENLRKLIGIMKPTKSLIFINELNDINTAVAKLNYHNLECVAIHSESTKQARQNGLKGLANGSLKYLVSTDLAARGLHIDDISCVYHMSIAENPSDYLHRAGRTGRNDAKGISLCLANKNEVQYLKKYISRFSIDIHEIKMRNGEITYLDSDKKVVKLF
ncbi:MAG: DEAD/DEAH box helicase [Clostridia bacterium]